MFTNVGTADRAVRILIGIAMLVWSYRRAGNGEKNQAHA